MQITRTRPARHGRSPPCRPPLSAPRARAGDGRQAQDRRADRSVRRLSRTSAARPRSPRRKLAVADFGAAAKGIDDRGDLRPTTRTSPMSAPPSRGNGSTATASTIVCDVPNSARWRWRSPASCAEKNKVYINTGAATSDLTGVAVQRQHDPLDLRHLDAGAFHRRRDGEGRRRQLVLHHRRLRLRPCAAARHHAISSPPPAARCWARSTCRSATPISPPSCCRRRPAAPRCSGCATPAPTPSTHQAGGRVRPDEAAASSSPGCWCSSPTSTRSAWSGAGAGADRELLLGPERPDPRLLQAAAGADRRQHLSGDGACRLLRRHAALPEERRGDGRARRSAAVPRWSRT